MRIRRAEERGHANHGWLDTYHTFSFADYFDPKHMGFGPLRVINDDRVAPARGFGTHPHRDMEIITYILSGSLEHKDSMGTGSVIRPGDIQRMSAGTGVTHSEFNPSPTEEVHLLQIWILPERQGIQPSYEQKHFSPEERRNILRLVASKAGQGGAVKLHQDVNLYATLLDSNRNLTYESRPGRLTWIHVARGELTINGKKLKSGDAAYFEEPAHIEISALSSEIDPAEFLTFDLVSQW